MVADEAAQAIESLPSKFVTLADGVKVHYQEAGPDNAPVILLTHGFLGSLRDWQGVTGPLAALAEERGQPHRVIALDWVGFGRSSKPAVDFSLDYFANFLRQFAEAIGLERFSLAGHSMGGKHNLAFALRYPQYIERLVLVDCDGFLPDPWWTHQGQKAWSQALARLAVNVLGSRQFMRAYQKNVFFDPRFYLNEAEITQAALDLQEPAYKAVIVGLRRDYARLSLALSGYRARLSELGMPVQIFWGLQDRILHVDQGHAAQSEIPTAQLYVFDRCGHFPQVEKAAEFNERVLEFLTKPQL